MAPIPKDTKDKPQDSSDANEHFHNPNLTLVGDHDSDSSDEEYDSEMVVPGGYSLLPSEPGTYHEESDSDSETGVNREVISNSAEGVDESAVSQRPQEEMEVESSASGVDTSEDCNNPAAREKYPFGKIPSYLHVPDLPKDKDGHLWNEKRQAKKALDKGQESVILKAMSGFQLPPESIPAWAKRIPEEQWRQQIQNRILNQSCDTDTKGQNSASTSVQSTKEMPAVSPDEHWVAEFPENT